MYQKGRKESREINWIKSKTIIWKENKKGLYIQLLWFAKDYTLQF